LTFYAVGWRIRLLVNSMSPSAERKRDYTIAVVGGGIGGLCCTIGLRHQGINVDLYEGRILFLSPRLGRNIHLTDTL